METSFLFVNFPDDLPEDQIHQELKLKASSCDKETLLKIIESLLQNNAALRKYIKMLEEENKLK